MSPRIIGSYYIIIPLFVLAFWAAVANFFIPSTVVTNLATIALTIIIAIGAIGQWLLPQHPPSSSPPPPLSPFCSFLKKQVVIYTVLCFLIGGGGSGWYVYTQLHPDNSFAHIVEGKTPFIKGFSDQWKPQDKDAGSCSPHPETETYSLVALPQVKGSAVPQAGGIYACYPTLDLAVPGDIALEVDMEVNGGDEAGIEFKVTSSDSSSQMDNFYLYSINIKDSTYHLAKDKVMKPGSDLPRTDRSSSAIIPGINSKNTLALTMIGRTICMYINQPQLRCVDDKNDLYGTGTIGLYVGAYPGRVTFSRLSVWDL
jgi:hypothetical protein